MEIGVVGLSHQNAAVEIREKIAFTKGKKLHAMETLIGHGVDELVILSTCNRVEIYFAAPVGPQAVDAIRSYCEAFLYPGISSYLYSYGKQDAISHLYSVTCGLESLVLGEDQILGQVKAAASFSMEHGSSKKVLNKVFRESITYAKRAKTQYKMSENPLSISATAVKYISQQVNGLGGKNVLIMGTGKIGTLILRYIHEAGDADIYITRRAHHSSHHKPDMLTAFEGVHMIDFEARYDYIPDMDAVFTATASPHVIVKSEALPKLYKPVVFMDVAVPRDVDIRIRDRKNVAYHDIDDLRAIVDRSEAQRKQLAQLIRRDIEAEVRKIEEWVTKAQVDEAIHKLNMLCDKVYDTTWDMIDKKIDLSEKDTQDMKRIVKSCIRKMVKTPIDQLKGLDSESDIEGMAHALAFLYDLEEA